ncbi:MAG: RNA methyltransferase [Clostridia bacterium]|nr:RNA methyltransferase [Clostridia bacterium]
MEYISSRTNPLIVRMAKLSDKKYRDEEKLFVAEGIKLFEELLACGITPAYAFATEKNAHLLDKLSEKTNRYLVSESVYEKISCEKAPQGVFCAIKYLDNFHKSDTIYSGQVSSSVFCLSSLRDPGNLGTVLRTARAFGIGTLILSSDCTDLYSPKTVRASMGALFAVRTLRTPDLAATLRDLQSKGYTTYAAALDSSAVTLSSLAVTQKTCFVVGNEGHGLSDEIISSCGNTVYIPMAEGCESLNASVAASLLMWELFKSTN